MRINHVGTAIPRQLPMIIAQIDDLIAMGIISSKKGHFAENGA
jgi:hypothetical protein